MYNGMIITDLISAVERAERYVTATTTIQDMKVIEMPVLSYTDELVVA